jgi:hypothetical protein
MGFDELGQSSLDRNKKLRSGTRKQFFPKTMSSPSFKNNSAHLDPVKQELLNSRMQLAEHEKRKRVRREYLLYAMIVLFGILIVVLVIKNS